MMMVTRITLSGGVTKISFEGYKCAKWLVKNFTNGDIYVSFKENLVETEAIKIKSNCGQVCIDNEYLGGLDCFRHDSIYIKGTGEVEVQELCYHQ